MVLSPPSTLYAWPRTKLHWLTALRSQLRAAEESLELAKRRATAAEDTLETSECIQAPPLSELIVAMIYQLYESYPVSARLHWQHRSRGSSVSHATYVVCVTRR